MKKQSKSYSIKEFAFVPPPYGGVSTYVKRLIERMNDLGIVTGGYFLSNCHDKNIIMSDLYDEWKWMPTHLFFFRIFKYIFETRKYKVIHSHFSLEGMLYLWFLKLFCRKKIVITVHNSMVGDYVEKTNFINRYFLKKLASSSKVTWIAVSDQVKDSMLNLPLTFTSEINIVPAYIPPRRNAISNLSEELQLYIKSYEKIIVFYGHSFMSYLSQDVYGFQTALRMYASLTNDEQKRYGLVYCIANSSDKELLELKSVAESLGILDKIYWQIGAIENMVDLWEQTDVYIRPTCTDGDSVAVREALDMGTQVVASDVSFRPDNVIKYPFGDDGRFVDAVRLAISKDKESMNIDDSHFIMMLNIYKSIL